ncbi:hypothetical protein NL676_028359 [Syzygium grande]|nr:hypothetical protein NL676_028359 [Syzygium grande]
MNTRLLLLLCAMFLVLMINMTQSQGNDALYSDCSNLFSCGNIQGVGYPFWGGNRSNSCGYPALQLACEDNTATIMISKVKYKVLGFYPTPSMVDGYVNSTIIYGCPNWQTLTRPFSCNIRGTASKNGYVVPEIAVGPGLCFKSVVVPVSQTLLPQLANNSTVSTSLKNILQQGFKVRLGVDSAACKGCANTTGVCSYDISKNATACYCADGSSGSPTCASSAPGGPQGQPVSKVPPKDDDASPSPSPLGSVPVLHHRNHPDPDPSFNGGRCGRPELLELQLHHAMRQLAKRRLPLLGLNRAFYCGLPNFELTCQGNTTMLLNISNQTYRVLRVDGTSQMTVARNDYWNTICPASFINTTSEITKSFTYTSDTVASNLTLYYGCEGIPSEIASRIISSQFNCTINGSNVIGYFITKNASEIPTPTISSSFGGCSTSVVLPANKSAIQAIESNPTNTTVVSAIDQGFGLQWTVASQCSGCLASGGQCGRDNSTGDFACYCQDKPYSSTCSDQFQQYLKNYLMIMELPISQCYACRTMDDSGAFRYSLLQLVLLSPSLPSLFCPLMPTFSKASRVALSAVKNGLRATD